jgi:hypothetical protein
VDVKIKGPPSFGRYIFSLTFSKRVVGIYLLAINSGTPMGLMLIYSASALMQRV